MSTTLGLAITTFLGFFTIYTLGSLAGTISEKSGIVNISLDGQMIMGGLTFALLYQSEGFTNTFAGFSPFVALLIAGFIGLLFSFALSVPVIYFMGDNVIIGTAMNLFAVAFAWVIIQGVLNTSSLTGISTSGSWAGTIDTTAIIMVILTFVIVAIAWFIIQKTAFGLNLKASGENPYALETSGVSVYNTRMTAISIAGFLAGIAGGVFIIASGTAAFSGTVQGSGYISIAILIIGRWNVIFITIASLFMAILMSLSAIFQNFTSVIPIELFNMIPYLLPLVFLAFAKTSASPLFVGKPYRKDIR